jgi:hypothetical protein
MPSRPRLDRRSSLALLAVLALVGGAGCPKNIPLPDASLDGSPDLPPDTRLPADAGAEARTDGAAPDRPDIDSSSTLCGGNQQVCCPGNSCAANGCCVSGRCVASGTTCLQTSQDSRTCIFAGSCGGCGSAPAGTMLAPCCPGDFCTAPKTVCLKSANSCISCGSPGLPCCADGYCDDKFSCRPDVNSPSGTCVSCGGPGQACCAEPQTACNNGGCCAAGLCAPNGSACAADGGTCANGLCASCGSAGKRCCGGSDDVGKACSQPDTVCAAPASSSGPGPGAPSCVVCGGADQACCAKQRCKDPGQACVSGLCKPCGMTGQACCAGDTCNGGGCCINSACIAAGASCGAPIGACMASVCQGCGDMGQPCCPTTTSAKRTSCHAGLACSPDALCVKM